MNRAAPILPPSIVDAATGWCAAWGTPVLLETVTIAFSSRLSARAGRAFLVRRLVRVASWLQPDQALLEEVVCHELAHIAAFDLHGPLIRPHGPEWRELMRRVGFPARVALTLPQGVGPPPRRRSSATRPRYLHRCPICRATRVASRRMALWRCAACHRSGRSGELEIERLGSRAAR